jgi:DNA-binding response OmpR family regulator
VAPNGACASSTLPRHALDLMTQVWGYSAAVVVSRTVDTHVAELRRKL